MKKMTKEVTSKVTYYVSADGREFTREEDCKSWEASYEATVIASFKKLKHITVNTVLLGLPYGSEDNEAYMVMPETLEDVVIINEYMKFTTNENCGVLDNTIIGKKIILNFGYEHEYCDTYDMSELIKGIESYVEDKTKELKGETDNG